MSGDSGICKNVIIFEFDNSSSVHADNRINNITNLGESPTDGLDDAIVAAESEYSISFSEQENIFCLSLHCNGSGSFLFLNGEKIYQYKTNDSEINGYSVCLGNISKLHEKTGVYGYVYDFSVDCDSVDVDGFLDIHKYITKKHDTKCFQLLKKCLLNY